VPDHTECGVFFAGLDGMGLAFVQLPCDELKSPALQLRELLLQICCFGPREDLFALGSDLRASMCLSE
jgi:hypothetical protein